MTLPENYARQLLPGTVVVFASRRAFFEIIEETAEGIFRLWILSAFAYWFAESTGRLASGSYWAGILLIALLIIQKSIKEILDWWFEVYVVTHDLNNGGGRVDKFWGWGRRGHVSEAITASSPAVIFDQDLHYRIWGWLTGEQMARITLKSANHTFIEGRRISPRLERAIYEVRGKPGKKPDPIPGDLASLEYLKQAMLDGLVDRRFASESAKALITRNLYGE